MNHECHLSATPPLFSTLPRDIRMKNDTQNNFVYKAEAVHPGNVVPQTPPASAMQDAFQITYGLEQNSDFIIDPDSGLLDDVFLFP